MGNVAHFQHHAVRHLALNVQVKVIAATNLKVGIVLEGEDFPERS